MPWTWFRRLLGETHPASRARYRTDRRPSPLPAMVEFLEPRALLSAAAIEPTASPVDLGVVNLNDTTGEWRASRFNGDQFVEELLTTWADVPDNVVTVQGDLWGTGQKEFIHYEAATGLLKAEWKVGTGLAVGAIGGWVTNMDVQYLTARDLNHDGYDDVLGMDLQTGNWAVTTMEAGGGNSSRFVGTWRTDVAWQHVNFADMNADGWDDIIGYNPSEQSWNVLLGGNSAFTALSVSDPTPTANISTVRTTGFDGSQGADLLYRNAATGDWTALSLVSGQFRTRTVGNWDRTANWVDVQTIDFWGLGREAIVGRNGQTNEWRMTWSMGSGFTTAPIAIWANGTYADAFVADVNLDGREDLVARRVESGQWFSLRSSPTRIDTVLLGTWPSQARYDVMQSGDFNADGRPDWIGHDTASGMWRGLISTGGGNYTNAQLAAPATGYVPDQAGVADFDANGRLDVYTRDQNTNNGLLISVLNNALVAERFHTWNAYGVNWTDAQTLDFNGDGDQDLLARDAGTGNWWMSRIAATTVTTEKIGQSNTAGSWQTRFARDFDGNGTTDLLERDAVTGDWHVLRMVNGIPTSTTVANWSASIGWTDFQVVDLFGNGRPMVVARNSTTNLWQGLWSSGAGFTSSSLRGLAPGVSYGDTRVVRFFGDQRESVVTRDPQTGVWYALWYGSNRFNLTSLGTWDPGGTWDMIVAADLEGNGRQSLIGHDAKSGQTWRLSFDGTSAVNTVISVSAGTLSLRLPTVGRFTETGHDSILVQETGTGRWYRLHHNGAIYGYLDLGVWSETTPWLTTSVGDYDRDGRDDLWGHSGATSTWTLRTWTGSDWSSMNVGNLPASGHVNDVAGASDATMRAIILQDVPGLAAAVTARDVRNIALLLRNWVANAADAALYSNLMLTDAAGAAEAYFRSYARDRAGSSCGGYSEFFVQVLKLFQVDSLTVGLGDKTADLVHSTVTVPVYINNQWRFEFFDPTFNCAFTNSLTNSRATYFDLIDAARSGSSGHIQVEQGSNQYREFLSAVPLNDPFLTLDHVDNGVYVYRWAGYGLDDYLDTSRDTFDAYGYAAGLQGFFQLFPQVHTVQINNGSGDQSTSNAQRTAFIVQLAQRGIAMPT